MADISMTSAAADIGPLTTNVGTNTTPASTVCIGIDTAINPISVATQSSADVFALLERARVAMMDYFADNLR